MNKNLVSSVLSAFYLDSKHITQTLSFLVLLILYKSVAVLSINGKPLHLENDYLNQVVSKAQK